MAVIRRVALMLALCVFLAVGSACYRVTYSTGRPPAITTHLTKSHFFLWGIVGQTNVDLKQICPNGAAWWQNQHTFVDGLLNAITLGIYSPVTILVRCEAGQAYLLEPDPELGITWVKEVPASLADAAADLDNPSRQTGGSSCVSNEL